MSKKLLIDENDIHPADGLIYTDPTRRAAVRTMVINANELLEHAIVVDDYNSVSKKDLKAYFERKMSEAHEADIRSRQGFIAQMMADWGL